MGPLREIIYQQSSQNLISADLTLSEAAPLRMESKHDIVQYFYAKQSSECSSDQKDVMCRLRAVHFRVGSAVVYKTTTITVKFKCYKLETARLHSNIQGEPSRRQKRKTFE